MAAEARPAKQRRALREDDDSCVATEDDDEENSSTDPKVSRVLKAPLRPSQKHGAHQKRRKYQRSKSRSLEAAQMSTAVGSLTEAHMSQNVDPKLSQQPSTRAQSESSRGQKSLATVESTNAVRTPESRAVHSKHARREKLTHLFASSASPPKSDESTPVAASIAQRVPASSSQQDSCAKPSLDLPHPQIPPAMRAEARASAETSKFLPKASQTHAPKPSVVGSTKRASKSVISAPLAGAETSLSLPRQAQLDVEAFKPSPGAPEVREGSSQPLPARAAELVSGDVEPLRVGPQHVGSSQPPPPALGSSARQRSAWRRPQWRRRHLQAIASSAASNHSVAEVQKTYRTSQQPAQRRLRYRTAKHAHLLHKLKVLRADLRSERHSIARCVQSEDQSAQELLDEMQQFSAELKPRFRALGAQLNCHRKENLNKHKALNALSLQNIELQLAFVRLLLGRRSSLKIKPQHQGG